ncbi:MAG: transposase [bacterium]|nr:transposase [bacterium]
MRNIVITSGEYYHIYNRGNDRRDIFYGDDDYLRFVVALLLYQFPESVSQLNRTVRKYVQHLVLDTSDFQLQGRYAELVCFALMPNHFHLIIRELEEGGIARYMQRLLNGYTKYLNTKHEKSGHVFQGTYQAVHVEDDDQLCYLSAYIHRNPRDLPAWRNCEQEYPWSSYQDYVSENRWKGFLSPDIVLNQIGYGDRYRSFVQRSGAKERAMDSVLHIDDQMSNT